MKVCVIQPYYSFEKKDTERCYNEMMALLDQCDDSYDLIVLPEYCDVPAVQGTKQGFHESIEKYNALTLQKAKDAAVRCNAIVFVNAAYYDEGGYKNTTHAINRQGNIVGRYFKAHPAPSEVKTEKQGGNELNVAYSYRPDEPYVIEIEGLRFGFMTCYDFYFYESYAPLARKDVDIIIGCSHQRTDTHEALSIINRFLSYHTNAYLIRSSVSLGEESGICGCSCIIAPNGEAIVDMKSKIGLGVAEIDPKQKYYKPAGFKGKLKSHYEYIEEGRRPWLYRNGGKFIVPFNDVMGYPRLCAHRGFNAVAPENSMPAFAAAISLGASEIEFDLWQTKDGELVSCHDDTLDRVSNGTGKIADYTYEELLAFDFGVKYGEKFKGLKIPRFEDILQKFAGHTVMNIHIKTKTETSGKNFDEKYDEKALAKIVSLLKKYDCMKHVYFMISADSVISQFKAYAPEIPVCVGHDFSRPWSIVDRAIALGADKVQLFKPYFNQEMIDKAHEHGILCNVFWSDDPTEAKNFLDMGIDTVLTNDYLRISTELNLK